MIDLPVANAIWIGPRMGPLHAACLHSFVRAGYRVVLHCYESPLDTPEGVETADARDLLSEERIIRYRKGGSYSLFSNLFRYEIQRAGLGLYIDCDVYCLEPLENADYILGWSTNSAIGTAVIKLPRTSPVVESLSNIKDQRNFLPPWMPATKRLRYQALAAIGLGRGLEDLPWGTTGPQALTWYCREHQVTDYARPSDVFFPMAYYQFERLFDPGLDIADLTTKRTRFIHLFHEMFRGRDLSTIPAESPAGQMISAAGDALRSPKTADAA